MDSMYYIKKYDEYRNSVLNMQASENVLSPDAKKALSSDMASRYSLKVDNYNAYGGTFYFDELLKLLENNVKKLFDSKFSEVRPLSGHVASEISLLSIVNKNRNVIAISEENGGYPGYNNNNLGNVLKIKFYEIPYKNFDIDYDNLENSIKNNDIKTIILGQSLFIRHYDMKRIKEISEKYDCKIIYDASHVLGLIAGKQFQNDALKYSDILFGSTHKTFFGPQGGIILTNNDEIYNKIIDNTIFKTMDNINLSRIASLSIAVEEMLKYGNEYAKNVVKNTEELINNLKELKFGLIPASETHQVLLDEKFLNEKNYNFLSFSKELEKNKIIIDRFGRIGTQEITRYNINDMYKIASIFNSIYNKLNMVNEIKNIINKKEIKYW